jgi:NADPH-dependent 2,4-dienoyl-CoA reductase/sulfur reductase-like enzyme
MRVLIVGGSDAGIEAGLSAAAAGADVTMLVADAYPNFSVCGIPYYLSGEVDDWRQLAHRDQEALRTAGLNLRLNTSAARIDVAGRQVQATGPAGEVSFGYDRLIIATGAVPAAPRIEVLDQLGPGDGVHTYHRLLDNHAYLPLGSTAHKQGRVAGINATGGDAMFAGSLGTQAVRVFDRVIAATGLRAGQAQQAGFAPSSWSTPPTTTRRTARAPPRCGCG